MCLNFSILILWVLVTLALAAVLTVYVQLELGCQTNDECLTSQAASEYDDNNIMQIKMSLLSFFFMSVLSSDFSFLEPVCGEDKDMLCDEVHAVIILFLV